MLIPLLLQLTVAIPAGSYRPLYAVPGGGAVRVAAFRIDRDPVTRGDFLAFARRHPAWRPHAPQGASRADLRRPVTSVSWHAARAYCGAQGKRLPTVAEWEYVAAASESRRDAARDPAFVQRLVTTYATRPHPLPPVDAAETNAYGVRGMHGLAWEWTEDFGGARAAPSHGEHEHHHAHGSAGPVHDASCAGAAIGAADPTNYAAFLRFAVRSGLTRDATMESLGFRCAA